MRTRSRLYRQQKLPLVCIFLVTVCGGGPAVFGQTPWEAAPAKPAPLPKLPAVDAPRDNTNSAAGSKKVGSEQAGTQLKLPQTRAAGRQQGVTALPAPPQRKSEQLPQNNQLGSKNSPTGVARTPNNTLPPRELTMPNLPPLPSAGLAAQSLGTESLTTGLPSFPGVRNPPGIPTFPGASPSMGGAGSNANLRTTKRNQAELSPPSKQRSVALPGVPNKPPVTLVDTAIAASTNPDEVRELDSGSLIAVVGSDHILAGDMAQYVEPVVEMNRSRIQSAAQEKSLREQVLREVLKHYIEVKAMYQEFFRDAAGASTPDKLEEMKKEVLTKAGKIFFEKQVPVMMKKYEAQDLQDLERKLREKSLSLNTMKATFVEQVLAQELERKYVPDEYEITRDELLAYYQEHHSEWDVPQKARWKQLTVRFDRHDNNRTVVERMIKQLGNQVYLGGQSFEAVAKQSSEDLHASEGGIYDWTRKGSLKSKPLESAIFSIPLGRLSQVITDDVGMHIVVVLERTEAQTKSFAEAQAEIREKLSFERRVQEAEDFRAKVVARTPIWSRWSDYLQKDIEHIRPLEEAVDLSADD